MRKVAANFITLESFLEAPLRYNYIRNLIQDEISVLVMIRLLLILSPVLCGFLYRDLLATFFVLLTIIESFGVSLMLFEAFEAAGS